VEFARAYFFKIWSFNDGVTREIILPNLGWFFGFVKVGITELFLELNNISSRPFDAP
jgi:hypothetical protein